MLNGEFTVAGGDRRFRIVSGGARGQGLRLRQMGDTDGVFPGDGVTRGGGTECGGAAGSAGGGKRSALDNAVLAVWKVVSALFSVP